MKIDSTNCSPSSSVSSLSSPGSPSNGAVSPRELAAAGERQGVAAPLQRRLQNLTLSPLSSLSVPASGRRGDALLHAPSTEAEQPQPHATAADSAVRAAVTRTRRRLQALTEDSLRHVGGFSTSQEVVALADSRGAVGVIAPSMVAAARLAVAAEAVNSLTAFRGVLGAAGIAATPNAATAAASVRQLPPSERSRPLSALARQITSLPPGAVWPATNDFRAAVGEMGAADRSPELEELLRTTGVAPGDDRAAAASGGNVRQIAAIHGITDPAAIRALEAHATASRHSESAGGVARAGANVLTVATRFGITSDQGIAELENVQITSPHQDSAGTAARRGEPVAEIAARHGITTPAGRARLQSMATTAAALGAMEHGERAQSVINRLGITSNVLIQQLNQLEARHRAELNASSQGSGKGRP
jgi:hypothetical protein